MVEYHGWFVLCQSLDGENEDNKNVIFRELSDVLANIYFEGRTLSFRPINGSYVFNTSGITNHFTVDVQDIINFFELVAKKAVGSYGLLYLRNDEDNDNYNNFTVWRLAKGVFEPLKDNLLSPCNPVIEEDD